MIRAIPYTFSYSGNQLTKSTIDNLMSTSPKYDKNDVIGTIRAYDVVTNRIGNPERIYIWISANHKNTKNSPLIENHSGTVSGSIDNSHTACNDIVVSLSLIPNKTLYTHNGRGGDVPAFGMAVVFFEGSTNIAIHALKYVYDIFNTYISDFSVLHQSNRYLDDIMDMIDEIKVDYIAPYGSGNRKVTLGYSTLRPRYTGINGDIIQSFLTQSMDVFEDLTNVARRTSIKAFGKKIELTQEDGQYIAMSFPQNIELSSFDMGGQPSLLFERVFSIINSTAVIHTRRVVSEIPELHEYLDSLMIEYETSRAS